MMGTQVRLASIVLYALLASSSALYSAWSDWSPCSSSCNGEQNRKRSCLTADIQPCEGKTQKRTCNTSGCYPSSEVIITCAVLGALILVLLIVLIIILVKKRQTSRRLNTRISRETPMSSEKTASNIQDINDMDVKKNNAERTISATPSTASQVTYLATDDEPAEKAFKPWGQKDCDLF